MIEQTQLLTLTEKQAEIINRAKAKVAVASRDLRDARNELEEKLQLIAPDGANYFDWDTMTFVYRPRELAVAEEQQVHSDLFHPNHTDDE